MPASPRQVNVFSMWTGLDQLLGALKRAEKDSLDAIGQALYAEANEVAGEADKIVPYDMGDLARSQIVHFPKAAGGKVYCDITYGGAAKKYALAQHERLDFRHPSKASGLPPNGRQAKYLSTPAEKAMMGFNHRMAVRVEAILKGLI